MAMGEGAGTFNSPSSAILRHRRRPSPSPSSGPGTGAQLSTSAPAANAACSAPSGSYTSPSRPRPPGSGQPQPQPLPPLLTQPRHVFGQDARRVDTEGVYGPKDRGVPKGKGEEADSRCLGGERALPRRSWEGMSF